MVLIPMGFVATGLACFGLLAKTRPPVEHLTEFYLLVYVGRLLCLPWMFAG